MQKEDLRIIFMGTPEFAVPSLEILLENGYTVVGVITAPDKPAGRGLQMQQSAIKQCALKHQLPVLQPQNLKDPIFITELENLHANLQIVVAFRMLPERVWNMPVLGTFNLHGSLLPQYRGAAPINWAVMNGEKETGVTTFFLQHEIDTGKIIHSAVCPIEEQDTAGSVHDKLMQLGANLVLKTTNDICSEHIEAVEQMQLIEDNTSLKSAPKIHKTDCRIQWNLSVQSVVNKIRGLSPFPTAFAEFTNGSESISIKIFEAKAELVKHNYAPGNLLSDSKTYIKVACVDGFVHLLRIQLAGKKQMSVGDFLRGFQISGGWNAYE
ncbi:MAG: methionyl-tRNA formyltransferase [Bacteroidia bacterium]|nr:methionyl-tRNA formyltransferase [Bacteroidia bacterium]